jgi:hypothetical protein
VAVVPLAPGPSGTPQPSIYLDLWAIPALQCWPCGLDLVTVRMNPCTAAPAYEITVTAEVARELRLAWVDSRCAMPGDALR